MLKRLITLFLLLSALAPASASAQSCDGALEWTGIVPDCLLGSATYHVMFITTGTRTARSTDINNYNTYVQEQAAGAALFRDTLIGDTRVADTFRAIGSTRARFARDNTRIRGRVFYFNGRKVADNFNDFWDGSWDSLEGRNQNGVTTGNVRVWTGGDNRGIRLANGFWLGAGNVLQADSGSRTNYLGGGFSAAANGNRRPFYAVSGLLRVPPGVSLSEPSSATLPEGSTDRSATLTVNLPAPATTALTVLIDITQTTPSETPPGVTYALDYNVAIDGDAANFSFDSADPDVLRTRRVVVPFARGQSSRTLKLTALSDADTLNEELSIKLADGDNYRIDTTAVARTLTLADKPTVTGVTITSTGPYALGEVIELTATFSEEVTVFDQSGNVVAVPDQSGNLPQIRIVFDDASSSERLRQADYTSGSGSTALVFSYTVLSSDNDDDGVLVERNALRLNGGGIQSALGGPATLSHAAIPADPAHRVDVIESQFLGAIVDGDTLTLTYTEALNEDSVPASTDWRLFLRVGAAPTVTADSVIVSGMTVTMTLKPPVEPGAIVGLIYTPGTNPLLDLAGNRATNLGREVVNTTLGLAINSPAVDEGNIGSTTTLTYVVTLAGLLQPVVDADLLPPEVIVRYNIEGNSTATRDTDYEVDASEGTFTFTPTVTTQNIVVTVLGDTLHEPTETIIVRAAITSPRALDATGTGRITNDDLIPVVSLVLTPNSIARDDSDGREGRTRVTARLDRISSAPTRVTVRVTPVSPAVTGDYRLNTNRSVLNIAAGELSSTGFITITAVNNGVTDPREVTVSATVANISNDITNPSAVTLTITPTIPGVNICDRTPEVRDAILAAARTSDCTDVALASITGRLNLAGQLREQPQSGDFDGLFRLEELRLERNSAVFGDGLPTGLFRDLQSLETLRLFLNGLKTLPANIFNGLPALEDLALHSNALTSIDVDAFNGLHALEELRLLGNDFTEDTGLPDGVFDEVLGNLGVIGEGFTGSFSIDSRVRAAHFVCSRDDDAAAIVAFVGATDCLRVTSAQFNVYRNTRLSGLVISAGALTPVFAPDTTAYTTAIVPNNVATVTVTPTASQTGSTITISGSNVNSGNTSDPIDLTAGTATPIDIVVTAAEAAGAQTYTVTITRASLPIITAIELTSGAGDDGIYTVDDTIDATVTFSEPVIVTDLPQLALTVGTQTRQAVYVSGTTTSALVFRYTVRVGDSDSDGVTIGENSLRHTGSSTIRDALTATTDAMVRHQVTVLPNREHKVDGVAPTVTGVAITAGPHGEGTAIEVTATFSEAVTVVGTPQIPLTVGTAIRQAVYTGGSDSPVLAFRYTVVARESDDDGVEVAQNALTANGGTIRDIVGHDAVLAHAAVAADTVNRVETIAPTLFTATIDFDILTLTYNERLDASSAPAPADYTLEVNNADGVNEDRSIGAVTVSGPMTVRLVLMDDRGVDSGFTVRLAYAATAANPLRDLAGNRAAGFPLQDVKNNTEDNTPPDFGSQTIGDLTYFVGRAIPILTLPTPTGGNGALSYTLDPQRLPNGLTHDTALRQITGAPRDVTRNPATYTYTVSDSDSDISSDDTDSLTFTIATRTLLGAITGSVTEDGDEVSSAVSSILRLDGTRTADFTAQSVDSAYGTFTIGSTGDWSYVLNNAADAVQSLAAGETVADQFIVETTQNFTITITITITGTNDLPNAEAGARQTVTENDEVTLVGTGTDPDVSDVLTYQWAQTGTPTVELISPTSATAGFTAPILNLNAGETEDLTFTLTVTDSQVSATDTVIITVMPPPAPAATLRGTLTEADLFAATTPTVTVTLARTEYVTADDLLPSHFTPTDNVAGEVTVTGVTRDTATTATLALAYNNVDIITATGTLSITVAAAGHTNDDALTTGTIPITASAGVNICGRTSQVQDAILAAITPPTDCSNVPTLGLESVTVLDLANQRITALQSSDFAGLTELVTLDLSTTELTTLPADIFAGLTALATLDLSDNEFIAGGLPTGVFDDVLNAPGETEPDITVDLAARQAHFVCSRDDADAIVTATGVTDCLQISSAQLNTALSLLSDATLSQLTISDGAALDPVFAPGTTTYTATVLNRVVSVTVTPVAAQTRTTIRATITVNANPVDSGSGSARITLIEGTPEDIVIAVTAADTTTTQTYTVTVTRAPVPSITAIELTSNGVYAIGDAIEATVTFSPPVTVTGRPQLALTVGPQTRQAVYASGSSTDTATALVFRYTVAAAAEDEDNDGVSIGENALAHTTDTNGSTSTIRATDDATTDALITHSVTVAADTQHSVDGVAPTIVDSDVAISSTGPYVEGNAIELTATFSEAVTVDTTDGTPQIPLTVGPAVYASGSSTATVLVFRHIVAAGDNDDDGVEVAENTLTANGGTIRDAAGNNAVLAHNRIDAAAANRVDTATPTVSTATINGATLTLTYNEVLDTNSVPALTDYTLRLESGTAPTVNAGGVTIDGATVTLALSATVLSTDVVTLAYTAAANPLRDLVGNQAADLTTQAVENTTPGADICDRTPRVRDAIRIAAGATDCADVDLVLVTGTLNLAGQLEERPESGDFDGLSALQELRLGGNSGVFGGSLPANLFLGLQSLERLLLRFNGLTALPADIFAGLPALENLDLRNNALASIGVGAFNGLDALNMLRLETNTIGEPPSPSFRPGTGLPDGVFDAVLNTLGVIGTDFTVDQSVRDAHFVCSRDDRDAIVTATDGVTDCLRISSAQLTAALPLSDATLSQLIISPGTLDPVFAAGTTAYTATVLNSVDIVTVTPVAAQTRTTITVNANPVDSGSARITLTAPAGTPEDIVIAVTAADATTTQTYTVTVTRASAPSITAIALTSNAGDGVYAIGDAIEATVTFSQPVTVTNLPQLALTVGTQTRQAVYASDSSTATALAFRYTVAAADEDDDGVSIDADALTHITGTNASTIRAVADTTTDALITHSAVAADTQHRVDGVAPTIVNNGDVAISTGPYIEGEAIELTATFSEAVTVDTTVGTPQIELTVDATPRQAVYASGSTTTALVFSYTVVAGENDADGVEVAQNALEPNNGTIRDAAGNNAVLDHNLIAATPANRVDTAAPTISTATIDGRTLTLTYDEELDAISVPAPSDYTLRLTSGTAPTVNTGGVTISGTRVTLALSAAVVSTDDVTLTYTADANPLLDLAGNRAADLSAQTVDNTTDALPSFGTAAVAAQIYTVGVAVDPVLQLPAASGGNEPLSYTLAPALPNGLTFNAENRQISGTPTASAPPTTYTLTATDADASDPDSATLEFMLTVIDAVVSATLTATAPLTEAALFASTSPTVTVTLVNTEYEATLTPASFTVSDTVAGGDITLDDVNRGADGTTATLTLGFDGADLTGDGDLSVTVTAAGHTGPGDLSAGSVSITASTGVNVCGRTAQVRDAIVGQDAIVRESSATECTSITELASITVLDLGGQSIVSLQPGDFAGLTALQALDLFNNHLEALPATIFAGLTALQGLGLGNNALAALPATIFDGLTALEILGLGNNALKLLPATIFNGLEKLNTLGIFGNDFTANTGLPAGTFDDVLDTLGPITTPGPPPL